MNPRRYPLRRLAPALAAAALAWPLAAQDAHPPYGAAAPGWQSPQDSEHRFLLYVGETRVLKLPSPAAKTAIGNGKVISTSMVNPTDLLLIASDAGRSSLHLWLQDGSEITYAVEVGLNSPEKTFAQVRDLLGKDKNIQASLVGNRVFLQAETLTPAQAQLIGALQKAFPDQIVVITGGDLALEERTVFVNVQLVEIKRSALEKLGVQWDSGMDGPSFGIVGDAASNQKYLSYIRPPGAHDSVAGLGHVGPFRTALSLASVISSRINLMRQQGDAYVVAEPRLTARCGGKADFTSGGELPIPVQSGLGSTNVEFKEYGIRLSIEPQCDKLGNIRAKVATEVSQIDNSVAVLGVPGLLTRKVGSELDLAEGRSMLMSGLASYSAGEGEDRVPFLGSIPLLGYLFRSKDSHGERSELVVIVTPHFVTPESEQVRKGLARRKALSKETDGMLDGQGVAPLEEPGQAAGRMAGYAITGEAPWKPLRAYSDGRQTFIEMPPGIPPDRAPALLVVRRAGKQPDAPVSYRVQGSRYVVDSVVEHAMLVAGAGYYRQSVTIARLP